jgi:hypothetical protein
VLYAWHHDTPFFVVLRYGGSGGWAERQMTAVARKWGAILGHGRDLRQVWRFSENVRGGGERFVRLMCLVLRNLDKTGGLLHVAEVV